MLELTYGDLMQDNQGIFYYINEINPLPFTDLITVLELDLTYKHTHKNMPLSHSARSQLLTDGHVETLKELAYVIKVMYNRKWERVFEAFTIENDLGINYVDTISETVADTIDTETSNNVTEKVSAYDSLDLVDNETITTTGNVDNTTDRIRDYKHSRVDDATLQKQIQRLQDDVMVDVIFADVSSEILSHVF